MKSFVLSAMAVLLAAACSVKEDRSACPGTLIIDFTGLDISSFPQTDVRATSSGAPVLEEKVPAERYRDEYTASVPRTGTFLNLSYGDGGSFSHREGFTAMPGEEFPALYLQTEALDTENESVGIVADLHKVYCNITILMKSDGPYPYSVSVEGTVRGYGVDGALVRGPFSFSPVIDSGGKCSVRVPRQADSSLMLLIKEDDTTLREFARRISDAGSRCRIEIYDGAGHGFFNRRKNDDRYFKMTMDDVLEFLEDLEYITNH